MRRRDNNPRAFSETVSINAWRSVYDGSSGIADLHIDVVFAEGRVGGEKDSPVRFRLSLKQAEVHVIGDVGDIITFPAKDVARAPLNSLSVRKKQTKATNTELTGKGSISSKKLDVEFGASGKITSEAATEVLQEVEVNALTFRHMKTESGYCWVITPANGDVLDGQPWEPAVRRMTLKDTAHPRKVGEPPEPRIELRCRREDLYIEDIQFKDRSKKFWGDLSKAKKLAVEQYIKDELMKVGFECDDLSDPFAQIILADVIPEEG